MAIVFVAVASAWAWVVGRAIAFGPSLHILYWRAPLQTTSWYRLTPMMCRMPPTLLAVVPFVLALSQLPILYIQHVPTQLIGVLSLVSWHAFVPVFVVHQHPETQIAAWCVFNTALAAIGVHSSVCFVVPLLVFAWLLGIQIQVTCTDVVRHTPDTAREPRIV
jgi:hypothetical protein